jgi:hypothetical protein
MAGRKGDDTEAEEELKEEMVANDGGQLSIPCPVEVPKGQAEPKIIWTRNSTLINLNTPEFNLLVNFPHKIGFIEYFTILAGQNIAHSKCSTRTFGHLHLYGNQCCRRSGKSYRSSGWCRANKKDTNICRKIELKL